MKHRLAYAFNFSWNNYFKSFPLLFFRPRCTVWFGCWQQIKPAKGQNLQLIDEETAAHNDDGYYSPALFLAAAYRTCHCEKTRADRLTIKKSEGDLLCFCEHSRWMESTLGNILLWKPHMQILNGLGSKWRWNQETSSGIFVCQTNGCLTRWETRTNADSIKIKPTTFWTWKDACLHPLRICGGLKLLRTVFLFRAAEEKRWSKQCRTLSVWKWSVSQEKESGEEELSGEEEHQSRPVPDPLFSRGTAVINLDTWLLGGISVNLCVCVRV